MPSYIQITSQEPVTCIDVATQIHYLLTRGEAPNPNATFWDLTVGGIPFMSEDESHNVSLITRKRVSELSDALLKQSWEELERRAKANFDMVPGWHEGLRPEFEKLRDFFVRVSEKGKRRPESFVRRRLLESIETCPI